jgi:hypothetical protein
MDGLSVQTVTKNGNCLFKSLSSLLDDEVQYNRLWQKAICMCTITGNSSAQFLPVYEYNHLSNAREDYKVHIGMVVPAQRLNAGETRREMNY